MFSIASAEKASNWSSVYASAQAREKQDEANLEFMNLREQASREEAQRATDKIKALELLKAQLVDWVDRLNRLERTDVDYWEEGDRDWFFQLEGIYNFFYNCYSLLLTARVAAACQRLS